MNKLAKKKIIYLRDANYYFSLAAVVFSVLLIILGLFTLVIIQQPIQEKQLLQKKASVDQGLVNVSLLELNPSQPIVNQPTSAVFGINTQGAQTDGIQLSFDIITESIPEIEATFLPDTQLNPIIKSTQIEGGFRITLLATPTFGTPFSSDASIPLFKITFTPSRAEVIKFVFNQEFSKSTLHASNPPQDELNYIPDTVFNISSQTQEEDNPNIEHPISWVTDYASLSADDFYLETQQGKFTTENTTDLKIHSDPGNDTYTTLEISWTEKDIPQRMNLYFSADSDSWQVDEIRVNDTGAQSHWVFFPYSYLKINEQSLAASLGSATSFSGEALLTSDVNGKASLYFKNPKIFAFPHLSINNTPTPTPPDYGGLEFKSCNQPCTSHSQCEANLACYQGFCRLASNLNSTSCATPTDQGLNKFCNEYCADDNECGDDYICHQNRCRLPDNLEDSQCIRYITTTNYQTKTIYVSGKTKPTQTKGGTISEELTENSTDTSTQSAIINTSPTPSPSSYPFENNEPEIDENQTALTAIINNLKSRGIFFPLAMIVSGLTMIGLIFLLWKTSRSYQHRRQIKPIHNPSPKEKKYINDLKQKITNLESHQNSNINNMNTPITKAANLNNPTTENQQVFPQPIQPGIPTPEAPISQQDSDQGRSKPLSMTDRLRQKQIKPPGLK